MLEVKDLRTHYRTQAGAVHAVDGVSFTLAEGENLGLVGESGCGKTTVAKTLLRVLPDNATTEGAVSFEGRDLLAMSRAELNEIRWKQIAMIAQSALNALDPVQRVGDAIVETLQVHTDIDTKAARRRAAELFALVGLERGRLDDYPHQLSGGMRQRAVIATALSLDPRLIIADEPTTALDVVVQDGILSQLQQVQEAHGNAMILVTHDISVVAEMCHRTAVMYAGRIAEIGATADIFDRPSHPYTMGLLRAYPTLESAKGDLVSIPGTPPGLLGGHTGCRFAYRCPFATDLCRAEDPPEVEVEPGHLSACHYAEDAAAMRAASAEAATWLRTDAAERMVNEPIATGAPSGGATLDIEGLEKHFPLNQSFFASLFTSDSRKVHAVDDVTLDIQPGEIVGLAGESGSGKSTLGEIVTGLQRPTGGQVLYDGEPVDLKGRAARTFRRHVQMVFQDPYQTLNPRFTVSQAIEEPLRNLDIGEAGQDRRDRIATALERSGLPPAELLERYPHELSGGQRQRVAIARGIVVEPQLLVADEPVSMLDVSIRAGVLNLFKRFRDELGMSILYISHDLATIRYICDRTAILYLGRIAELGPTEEVMERPQHPYTRLLLASVPRPTPGDEREKVDARGEIPDAIELPNGCRFHSRCASALPGAGWEGRDLLGLVQERQVTITEDPDLADPEEATLLEAVGFRAESTDLVATASGSVTAAQVAGWLRGLMDAADQPIAAAVTEIDVADATVTVRFAAVEEPSYREVADGHRVLCATAPWCAPAPA